jgi:hypothetical protein
MVERLTLSGNGLIDFKPPCTASRSSLLLLSCVARWSNAEGRLEQLKAIMPREHQVETGAGSNPGGL